MEDSSFLSSKEHLYNGGWFMYDGIRVQEQGVVISFEESRDGSTT